MLFKKFTKIRIFIFLHMQWIFVLWRLLCPSEVCCLWIISKKASAVQPVSPCMPFFFSVQLCCPFPGLLHRPPPGFVWPSIRLQRDLMTFIIRWGNLIWAAPLSEMSSLIWNHAGENKRVSNYSFRVWVGWCAVCGWREQSGSRRWEKEWEEAGETRSTVYERNQ